MAYDETLAERIRDLFPNAEEKRMFGSVGWSERGNLVVGIWGDDLIARVGPTEGAKALQEPGVKPFTAGKAGGKGMAGWVLVAGEELDDDALAAWVERCRAFVRTLPAK